MTESEAITKRMKMVWHGPCWHGPSLTQALDGVTAAEAAAHPASGCHSIWELAGHITAWREAAALGVESGVVNVAQQENFPAPAKASEPEWRVMLDRLRESERVLLSCLGALKAADLDRVVQGESESYSIRFLLNGVPDHDLYHAGQISLLRRAR